MTTNKDFVKEKRVSFDTAKLLKEKSFVWQHIVWRNNGAPLPEGFMTGQVIPGSDGYMCYNDEGKEICPKLYSLKNNHYPRPTLSLAQTWLREVHNLHIQINVEQVDKFTVRVYRFNDYSCTHDDYNCKDKVRLIGLFFDELFETYEKALEFAIQKCLKSLPTVENK